jgi:O-antigen/teichoic acid export membrane protein
VGDKYSLAVLGFQILVIGYCINVLTGMGTSMVRGIGKPEYETRYAVLTLVMQLVLSIVLVQILGFKGVLTSVLITTVTAALYFLITFHKLIGESFWQLAHKVYLRPLLASALSAIIAYIPGMYLRKLDFFSTRWGTISWLCFELAFFWLCYAFFIIKLSYLKLMEIQPLTIYFKPKTAHRICSLFGE